MLRIIIYFVCIGLCFSQTRKISSFVNPGCNHECSTDKNVLVHVKADGSNDTLHHIWDFTFKPAIVLAVTSLETTLSINWTSFLKGETEALQFSSSPFYTFSYVFDQILEFNDVNNTAIYDPDKFNSSDISLFDPRDFEWKFIIDKYQNTSTNAFAVMEGKYMKNYQEHHKTTIVVTLSAYGTMEHSKIQPHLLHTVNASQIDIVIDDFPTTQHFQSRFALVFAVASSDSSQSSLSSIRWRSLDDEHSPGVFTVAGVTSSRGYLEWRTVAYTTDERLMTSSTDVTSTVHNITSNDSFSHTAFFSLMGNKLDKILTSSVILSFGQPGDAFYSTTRYISWTFLGGIGRPVNEGFSQLVFLIVSIGIAIPALLIIVVGTCIVWKRMSSKSHDIVFSEH